MPTASSEDLRLQFKNFKQYLAEGVSSVIKLGNQIAQISNNSDIKALIANCKTLGNQLSKLDIKKPTETTKTLIEISDTFSKIADAFNKIKENSEYAKKIQANSQNLLNAISNVMEKIAPMLKSVVSLIELVAPPPISTGLTALKISLLLLQKSLSFQNPAYEEILPKVKSTLESVLHATIQLGEKLVKIINKEDLYKIISNCQDLTSKLSNLDLNNPSQLGELFTGIGKTLNNFSQIINEIKEDTTFISTAKSALNKLKQHGNIIESAIQIIEKADAAIKIIEPLATKFAPPQISAGLILLKKSLPLLKLACNGLKTVFGQFFSASSMERTRRNATVGSDRKYAYENHSKPKKG